MIFSMRVIHTSCNTIKHTHPHHSHAELARGHPSYTYRYVVKDRYHESQERENERDKRKGRSEKQGRLQKSLPKTIFRQFFSPPITHRRSTHINTCLGARTCRVNSATISLLPMALDQLPTQLSVQ